MIDYWQTKLPGIIYNVEYEKIVKNTEDEIKKLINFCDLEWDKNCLEFYNNNTTIKTLSVNQARKKFILHPLIHLKNSGNFRSFKNL